MIGLLVLLLLLFCQWSVPRYEISVKYIMIIENLRTTMKFTTTMSLGWEKTGKRTSVWAGKRKLKMQSIGRLTTTTTLNVNTNVKLWCSFATKFFAIASFKTMQDLICLSRTSNFIDHEKFFVLSDLFEWKNLLSVRRLFNFNWMYDQVRVSVRV